MVLFPGCVCCPQDCGITFNQLKSASTISITVGASDYVKKSTISSSRKVTQLWPGALYAGTFSLTKTFENQFQSIWEYQYPVTGLRCSGRRGVPSPRVWANLSTQTYNPVLEYQFFIELDGWSFDWIDSSLHGQSEFSCNRDDYSPIRPCAFCLVYVERTYGPIFCTDGAFPIVDPTPPMSHFQINYGGTVEEETGTREVVFSDIEFVS